MPLLCQVCLLVMSSSQQLKHFLGVPKDGEKIQNPLTNQNQHEDFPFSFYCYFLIILENIEKTTTFLKTYIIMNYF